MDRVVHTSSSPGHPNQALDTFRVRNWLKGIPYGQQFTNRLLESEFYDIAPRTIAGIMAIECAEGRVIAERVKRGYWIYYRVHPVEIRRIPAQNLGNDGLSEDP